MYNQDSIQAVAQARLSDHHVKPIYDTYGFAQIPATVTRLLTGTPGGLPDSVLGSLPREYDKVIVILLDAFGWRFFEPACDESPFLQRIVSDGVVSKLTAQFPSTTSAHLPTIHTGLPVNQTGVYEWYYYEPTLDTIISPLVYSTPESNRRNTLQAAPETLFPFTTLYHRLEADGVASTVFQNRSFTPSPFAEVALAGAKTKPFITFAEGLANLVEAALADEGKGYYFLYYERIDTIAHVYGPATYQVSAQVESTLAALEQVLHARLASKANNTLLLLTADHGQVEVSPETLVALNERYQWLLPLVKRNRHGRPLLPAGSARDAFLYVREDAVEEVYTRLAEDLRDEAEVYRTRDLIERGYFGMGEPAPRLLERVGDLVVLPRPGGMFWWSDPEGRYKQTIYGHHGGLSAAEMEIPLLAYAYGA